MEEKFSDKDGYNALYGDQVIDNDQINSRKTFINKYQSEQISPFCEGGVTKGYVRSLSVKRLIEDSKEKTSNRGQLTILDAGSGKGELSVYLACLGFKVVGIDISERGCELARELAQRIGVDSNCRFIATSLEDTGLQENSIDYVIGHAALHHFIKYEEVAKELYRIMKKSSKGYFADSYGENKVYHLFHDKEKMKRLGDVVLSKQKIFRFFKPFFKVKLIPTNWFTMFDKFLLRITPEKFNYMIRAISKVNFYLDRKIPISRISLFFSGSVLTVIVPEDESKNFKKVT